MIGDSTLYATPAEMRELAGAITALLAPFSDRLSDPAARPADSRAVTFLHLAFPSPDRAAEHTEAP